MKQKRLYVMCGPSGQGKSSWVQERLALYGGNWISRDLIRFSLVEADEDYFSHENQVLREFYKEINNKLSSPMFHSDVYADATHLTTKARREFFYNIGFRKDVEVIAVSFEAPVEVAIERNLKRMGRSNVPEKVIRDMHKRFVVPRFYEGFDAIIHVNQFGDEWKEVKPNE